MENQFIDSAEFKSGMAFLNSYAKDYDERKEKIQQLKKKLDDLQPAVQEALKAQDEIENLTKLNKSSEKFLMDMNSVILSHTGQPVSNGPLFEEAVKTGESDEE